MCGHAVGLALIHVIHRAQRQFRLHHKAGAPNDRRRVGGKRRACLATQRTVAVNPLRFEGLGNSGLLGLRRAQEPTRLIRLAIFMVLRLR